MKLHHYRLKTEWTGNRGLNTIKYDSYDRDFKLHLKNKNGIEASADPAFRGDETKPNPEEFLLSAISSCHMLWFLHECSDHGIEVVSYEDEAYAEMEEEKGQGGRFIKAVLTVEVEITDSTKINRLETMHENASRKCFIANSCNFPIEIISRSQTGLL
ncbi:MAG: OsmC family protein [Bacteroidia bacterium]